MELKNQDSAHTEAAHAPGDRLLPTKEAARVLGVSPATLNSWRSTGRVRLPFLRIGRSVRYSERRLLEFINEASA